jgi:hypothetical protein
VGAVAIPTQAGGASAAGHNNRIATVGTDEDLEGLTSTRSVIETDLTCRFVSPLQSEGREFETLSAD